MIAVTILTMKFEAVLGDLVHRPLSLRCQQLQKALRDNDSGMVEIYQYFEGNYAGYIERKGAKPVLNFHVLWVF